MLYLLDKSFSHFDKQSFYDDTIGSLSLSALTLDNLQ